MSGQDWRSINRAHWDELVTLHTGPRGYGLDDLRAGHGKFGAIVESELGPVAGQRILHLQCHFGRDTLILAQRGATVTGLDFSEPAIEVARTLAGELGLADRTRFVQADLYDACDAIPEPSSFDQVFVTWGAIWWLPDIIRWAQIVAFFIRPGGALYLAEMHPTIMVFDDAARQSDGRPGFFVPYFSRDAIVMEEHDYIDETATLTHATAHTWLHRLSDIVTGLINAGLRIDWLHEHDGVTWQMFKHLVKGADGIWRWPDKPWLPLAFSLRASRR
jgi:SAM-dependent methyltransferase